MLVTATFTNLEHKTASLLITTIYNMLSRMEVVGTAIKWTNELQQFFLH